MHHRAGTLTPAPRVGDVGEAGEATRCTNLVRSTVSAGGSRCQNGHLNLPSFVFLRTHHTSRRWVLVVAVGWTCCYETSRTASPPHPPTTHQPPPPNDQTRDRRWREMSRTRRCEFRLVCLHPPLQSPPLQSPPLQFVLGPRPVPDPHVARTKHRRSIAALSPAHHPPPAGAQPRGSDVF